VGGGMIKRIYPEWFIKDLHLEEDKIRAKSNSLKYRDKVQFYCKDHGVYEQRVAEHIDSKTGNRKQGCPTCGKLKRIQTRIENQRLKRPDYPEWFIKELNNDADKQLAKDKILTWSDKVEFKCPIHGAYTQRIDAHMNTLTFTPKQGCPKCGRIKQKQERKLTQSKSRKEYPQWFIDELAHEEDKQRALNKTLTTSESIDFICPVHGVYNQYVGNHINLSTGQKEHGCILCNARHSSIEEDILNYVKSIYPRVESRNRNLIKNINGKAMELDIYIPDKNLAIEVNGSLWHGEKFSPSKEYHLTKYKICSDAGIRLISIFDKDWMEQGENVKQFLRDLLINKTKIQGRKATVRRIDNKEANIFYNYYHLKKGDTSISVSYGLYYNNDLVSVMSFSRPKYGKQKETEWDLARYCVKPGYLVIGGAEKLFKSFLKEFNPSSIVTYSDNDYFTGEVYPKLGFVFSKYTDLPYYWAKGNHFYPRQQCQVKILKDKYPEIYKESLSIQGNKEDYIMHKLGYYKVYRSGNKKWLWYKE
jgi:hypothetical protein